MFGCFKFKYSRSVIFQLDELVLFDNVTDQEHEN